MCTLVKFVDDAQLGGTAGILKGRIRLQSDLKQLDGLKFSRQLQYIEIKMEKSIHK